MYPTTEHCSLRNLCTLNLFSNKLRVLPQNIGSLAALTVLDVGNNKLRELPASLYKIKPLIILNLSNNRLTQLDSGIASLVVLRELVLAGYACGVVRVSHVSRLSFVCAHSRECLSTPLCCSFHCAKCYLYLLYTQKPAKRATSVYQGTHFADQPGCEAMLGMCLLRSSLYFWVYRYTQSTQSSHYTRYSAHVHTHTQTHIHTYTHTHTHNYTHIHTITRSHTYTITHKHAHTHIHIHPYPHPPPLSRFSSSLSISHLHSTLPITHNETQTHTLIIH
jgi:Leucine rich repeat